MILIGPVFQNENFRLGFRLTKNAPKYFHLLERYLNETLTMVRVSLKTSLADRLENAVCYSTSPSTPSQERE